MQIREIERRPAARVVAAGRKARPGGVPLRRLARRRRASPGGRCCRSGRRTGPARRTRRRRPSPPTPATWRSPDARVTADELEDVRRPRALLDRRLGGVRRARRDRRPGPLRPRVERAPPVRRRARRAALRRHPDLRRRRAAPTSPRTRSSFKTGVVAGAPPDALSAVGQLLGQPALRLARELRAQGYRWWIERFRRTFELFDVARIDHFRGFVSYWAVPEGSTRPRSTAAGGAARAPSSSARPSASSDGSRSSPRTSA